MEMAESSCFLCVPRQDKPDDELPFEWTEARGLCREHNRQDLNLKLDDGQSLTSALERVKPSGYPLEGSLLGWVYNPAFIGLGPFSGTKVWLDFVGGGMLVREDRFSASDHFERYALEQPRAVTLLYLVWRCGIGASVNSMSDAVRLFTRASHDQGFRPPHHQRAAEGLTLLIGRWNFANRLAARRSRAARSWPESHEELEAWIAECDAPSDGGIEGENEARFFAALRGLAARRFATIRAA